MSFLNYLWDKIEIYVLGIGVFTLLFSSLFIGGFLIISLTQNLNYFLIYGIIWFLMFIFILNFEDVKKDYENWKRNRI